MTAFLIGLFLGACLASGAWIIWGIRAMNPHDEPSDGEHGYE